MTDLTGQKFGRLEVQGFAGSVNKKLTWNCICVCGNTKIVLGCSLRNGHTQSCGCLAKEGNHTTHGHKRNKIPSKEYRACIQMKNRCFNINYPGYKNYGGRGIIVCPKWIESFESFYRDMGDCPNGMSLDRKDNDGNYEPENCRWATQRQQQNNKRNNDKISYKGETKTQAQWARSLGMNASTLRKRLHGLGWSEERALTYPVRRRISL